MRAPRSFSIFNFQLLTSFSVAAVACALEMRRDDLAAPVDHAQVVAAEEVVGIATLFEKAQAGLDIPNAALPEDQRGAREIRLARTHLAEQAQRLGLIIRKLKIEN